MGVGRISVIQRLVLVTREKVSAISSVSFSLHRERRDLSLL